MGTVVAGIVNNSNTIMACGWLGLAHQEEIMVNGAGVPEVSQIVVWFLLTQL